MRSDVEAGRAFVRLYTKDQSKQGLQAWKAQLTAITAGAATLTAGLATAAAAGGFLVKLAADAETTATSFKVLTGNVQDAEKLLAGLRKFGAETPFEFPELADASKKLLAFGVAIDDQIPTLTRIGDIASGLGIPIGELAELYGKAKVQGRLFAEDVNQLTGRGIPVIQEFAKQFGVADSEVRKLVETGQIGFPQLEKAFVSLTSEGGKFYGMMAEQSKTLNGLFSTFKDDLTQTATEMGKVLAEGTDLKGLLGELGEEAKKFGEAFNEAAPGLVESLKGLNDELGQLGATMTGQTESMGGYQLALEALNAALQITSQNVDALEKLWRFTNNINMTAVDAMEGVDVYGKATQARVGSGRPFDTTSAEMGAEHFSKKQLQRWWGVTPDQFEPQDPFAFRNRGPNRPTDRGPIQGPDAFTPKAPDAKPKPTAAEQKAMDAWARHTSAAVLPPTPLDHDIIDFGKDAASAEDIARMETAASEIGKMLGVRDAMVSPEQQTRRPPISGTFSAMAATGMGSSQGPVERTAKGVEEMTALLKEQAKRDEERLTLEKAESLEFVA
jgi:tape measure domain-containing protein